MRQNTQKNGTRLRDGESKHSGSGGGREEGGGRGRTQSASEAKYLSAYLSVCSRYVHRRQAVGRAAEGFVQPLDVGQPHLDGVEQVDLHVGCENRYMRWGSETDA